MAEPTPVRMACPTCGEVFNLPTHVMEVDRETNMVTCAIDRTEIHQHHQQCRKAKAVEAAPADLPPKAELVGRIHRVLATGAFIGTGGSRACSLCGTKGTECLDALRANGAPCCSGCGNGDTHPVPKGTLSCAEWAAEHHRADQ